MNNIINKFLLAVDKFMPEMNLRQMQCLIKIKSSLDLFVLLVGHLLKMNKEFKSLWRQDIQNTFTEMN